MKMTQEQTELLRRLFTVGAIPDNPRACPADLLRSNLENLEETEHRRHPDWIDDFGRPMLPRQIGCVPTEALDALVAFYLEHQDEKAG